MDTTKHDITTLFKQLGLPSRDSEIDSFIEQNSLPATTLLQDAPFWDEAQQHFIAESLAQDGDWSEVIDELDVRLRQ
ncbi:DUF2789 domain-containing protein [Pseudoalteromonas sp. SaAl2]